MTDETKATRVHAVAIKRLGKGDVTKMRELNALFASAFEDSDTLQHASPGDQYLGAFLADEQHIVMVAIAEGHLVGGLVAYCLPKFERERKEVFLYDLAVVPAYQRQGIGRSLVYAVQKEAKQMGAYLVFVLAEEGDEAVMFYESLKPLENLRTRNFDFDVS